MKNAQRLQFSCQNCENPLFFSVLDECSCQNIFSCDQCGQKYLFDDETLLQHLKKFEALCRQIYASQEILGKSAISVDIGNHHVEVPFNILLTRLSSVIELNINGKKSVISFRTDPLKDVPEMTNA